MRLSVFQFYNSVPQTSTLIDQLKLEVFPCIYFLKVNLDQFQFRNIFIIFFKNIFIL